MVMGGFGGEMVTLYKLKAITTTADENNLDLRDPLERYREARQSPGPVRHRGARPAAPGPGSAHFPRTPRSRARAPFSHIDSSFSSRLPPAAARTGPPQGERGSESRLQPGPQMEGVVQDHRRGSVASLGQAGPRSAAPEALDAVCAGERAWRVAALLAPPASDLGSPPNTLARKAAPGQRQPGPRPEPDGAAGLGSRSKAVPRTPFLKTVDFSRICQVLSSSKKAPRAFGETHYVAHPCWSCSSPRLPPLSRCTTHLRSRALRAEPAKPAEARF
ncbi:uncharacterized protein LOC123387279 [Mustela putorius furo]|uniref:Uncharacterized protein LOC123387279 n=1 Tax=Mustela putorius furo TaxID=9669 RepID=A0A8U0R6J9_MUSPF|nr:uncharacterized protein LOC123387279 [Mustela putorius furo]